MKEWQKKMWEAMKQMQAACEDNPHWNDCQKCPFDKCCTALMDAALIDPYEGINWNKKTD